MKRNDWSSKKGSYFNGKVFFGNPFSVNNLSGIEAFDGHGLNDVQCIRDVLGVRDVLSVLGVRGPTSVLSTFGVFSALPIPNEQGSDPS